MTWLKVGAMAIAGVVLVLIGNTNRGVTIAVRGLPWVVLVVLVVLVAWSFLLGRTRFGRYIYAIGGNAEASRRAGINLNRIRVAAFALAGLTAGIMGIVYASYLGSVSTNVQGGNNVLYAVAAAVIGGVSLFGGRGKMLGAVLGGIIVAVIYNGLQLLGLGAAAQNIWTALVLLAAVTVDTVARRTSRRTSGRRTRSLIPNGLWCMPWPRWADYPREESEGMPMRLAVLSSDEMTTEQLDLYRDILGGPRGQGPRAVALSSGAGGLAGPFNAMLYAPSVGHALQELGAAIRFRTELAPRIREMAILVVAQAWDSGYERTSHEPIGREAGLTEPEIEALRDGADPGFTDKQEQVAYSVVRALTGPAADLGDQEYDTAVAVLGQQALVELSALVGYYATLALQMRIFRVPAP